MSQLAALRLGRPGSLSAWLSALVAGVALGLVTAAVLRLGWVDGAGALAGALSARIGPVWIPMAGVLARVCFLAVRAGRSRLGAGSAARPVRPELYQLAPLFAALGLAGTVWGLGAAFDALDDGDFLARLPALLAGLGAAMTSTLVGLGLQARHRDGGNDPLR